MRYKIKTRLFVAYFSICFIANIWPLVSFANRIEPRLFGLPFLFLWCILWSCLVFAGLVALYLSGQKQQG